MRKLVIFTLCLIPSLFLAAQARAENTANVEQFLAQLDAQAGQCETVGTQTVGTEEVDLAVPSPILAGCVCSLGQDNQGNTCSCSASGAGASCKSSGEGTAKKCTCTDAGGTIVCQIVNGHCVCE